MPPNRHHARPSGGRKWRLSGLQRVRALAGSFGTLLLSLIGFRPSERPSPSPQPSPLGRGSTAARLSTHLDAPSAPACGRLPSLSPRERVGVRGKGPCDLPALKFTFVNQPHWRRSFGRKQQGALAVAFARVALALLLLVWPLGLLAQSSPYTLYQHNAL